MDKVDFNEEKILDALQRSGYLFESEISKKLTDNSFFVESNAVIIDKYSRKSREIDLIAEYHNFQKTNHEDRCSCTIKFVFEIKNTNSPLLLLTEYQHSPIVEAWDVFKELLTIPSHLSYYNDKIRENLLDNDESLYTQYCSFQEKKGSKELMALHPDNIHSGLQKIVQYCEEHVRYEHGDTDYLRHFIYLPVLLISEDLYELKIEDSIPKIYKTEEASLIYNYHQDDEPKACLIKIITKNGFNDFMQKMLLYEKQIEEDMVALRKKQESRLKK